MQRICLLLLVSVFLFGFVEGRTVSAQALTLHVRNPIIWADVPDPAVIRVGDIYYMTSTTMHMSPGVPIMKSTNLVDWEMVGYVYNEMANADALFMRSGQNAYGRGSWASSIRYHDGLFYVATFSYTTGESYIFTTEDVENGPWHKESLGSLYHDASLFFDDDDRVYLIYAVGDIRIIELTEDALAVKQGGVDRVLIPNVGGIAGDKFWVPGEGSHFYKIDGTYYLFLIVWPAGGMRTQLVYRARSLEGPWEGQIVLEDEGIAQGGIVQTSEGDWYALLFGDRGAVGRIPYLIPVTWEDGWPVFGISGRVPATLHIPSNGTGVSGIVASDEFDDEDLGLSWQWNHNPIGNLWSLTKRPGYLRLMTGRTDPSFVDTRNTLTQRAFGPESSASTALDMSGMNDGDVTGLGLLAQDYGFVGVTKDEEESAVIMVAFRDGEAAEVERVPINQDVVYLRADADFRNQADEATFFYSLDGEMWTQIGDMLQMRYTLTHFMGYRFALFTYATETPGGWADFDYFHLDGLGEPDQW
ncbi:MAG TPA: glycoside hydrolase 43 family protein [Rhodothermales bacterium]|nr:glycoside hydrolase 43 family protein [Rhodothermales bacterium]